MQYAQIQVLPPTPPGGVTAGIDWATADHVACVVDSAGRVLDRISAAHDRVGIRKLVSALRAAGAAEVAIERGDGVLVDALLAAGLTVVVITSRQVKNLRSRYGSAGAKDDRFDAFVLADVLRTDRARLRPLVPDSPATLALRGRPRPPRPGRPPGRGLQPAARPPERLLPRGNRSFLGAGQPDQPGVPVPVLHPGRS
jgi:transposase